MSPEPFSVIFVGAGEINFGSPEGPWNHSLRLERALGPSLHVLGLIDPLLPRSRSQLSLKHQSSTPGYHTAQTWSTPSEAAASLPPDTPVDLIIVGAPPHFRGCTSPPANLDMQLHAAFPQTKRWLVEKPISAAPPTETDEAGQRDVLEAYRKQGGKVAAGYMLCALKGVGEIRRVIAERGLRVMGTAARYYMSYPSALKPSWWNLHHSCGPIVEQATHLASLSLLFGGPADLKSVRTQTVEWDEEPGRLGRMGISEEEEGIEGEGRIPRYTSSIWKYRSGAVGSLTHAIALHGTTYQTEFEVVCDGVTFKLWDMYTEEPKLVVLDSGGAEPVQLHSYPSDDPFQTQLDALISSSDSVYCSYEEALETYELTWAIRRAGERERAERRNREKKGREEKGEKGDAERE